MSRPDPELFATIADEALARTFDIDVTTLSMLEKTIAQNPHSTLEVFGEGKEETTELMGRSLRNIADGLAFNQPIGEGGMGLVHLATQHSLARQVAVKTLRPTRRSDATTQRFLREAWVTGYLEHPNIVPIYDLGLDEGGAPIIVLKYIEGVEWGTVLGDAEVVKERFGADDLLEWNIRILIQLCNAVSLAHSRGIVHRDLKPDNVMIGQFGEVYLMDWGLAVSLREGPSSHPTGFPKPRGIAGTPCYMAPEMLGIGEVTERTDVYLLGAVLHEILVGAPPHAGSTFRTIAASALLSQWVYPPEVSPELAEIAQRAMSAQPSARFASTAALRVRLEWYLRHRESLALSHEAAHRLVAMKQLAATAPGSSARGGPSPLDRERLYRLFAECRFGFLQALRASVENDEARAGLREATEAIVVYELTRGMPEAASAVLAELDAAPPELIARVTTARQEQVKKLATLEGIAADMDPATGSRARMAAAMVCAVLWALAPQVVSRFEPWGGAYPSHYGDIIVWVALCIIQFVIVRARGSLRTTSVNRRIVGTLYVTFGAGLALVLACRWMHATPIMATTLASFVMLVVTSMFTVTVDRRFWPTALAQLVALFVAANAPGLRWHVLSCGALVLAANIAISWRAGRPTDATWPGPR